MMLRICYRLIALALVVLLVESIASALAATNTVAPSGVKDARFTINSSALKPAACASLNLTSVVTGNLVIIGNAGNTLILGGSGIDTLTGQAGNDCLMGGGGDDTLNGGLGNDVLIGGPGIDTCIGGGGVNTYDSSCEVQLP